MGRLERAHARRAVRDRWRVRTGSVGIALVCFAWLASTARAQDPLAITWIAPAECPSLEDVRGYLDAVVPDDVRGRLEGLSASVTLVATGAGYRADVHVARGSFDGERSVEGRRCDDVARSAIIVISVALTEAADATVAETHESPEPVPTPVPEREVAPDPPVSSAAARSAWSVSGDAEMLTGFGSSSPSPRLGLEVRRHVAGRLEIGLRIRSVPWARLGDGGTTFGRAASLSFVPEACFLGRLGRRVRGGGCGLVDVGVTFANGRELVDGRRGASPWLAFALEPMLEVGDRIRFRLGVAGEARAVRPRYVVSGSGTVFRTPPFGIALRAGILFTID